MKLFLDTADTELIEKHFQTDLIDGITTNPTLIMKSCLLYTSDAADDC